jgi:hypothetical protein
MACRNEPLLTNLFLPKQNKKTHFSVLKGSPMGTHVLQKKTKTKKQRRKFFETKITKYSTETTRGQGSTKQDWWLAKLFRQLPLIRI